MRGSTRRIVGSVGIGCGSVVYTNTTSHELLGHGREATEQPKVIFTSRQQTERIELVLDTSPPSEHEEILDDSDEEELRNVRHSSRFHQLSNRIRSEEEIEQAQVAANLENRVLHPDPSMDNWIKQTALAMAKTEEFQKHFQAQIRKNPPPVVLPALPTPSSESSSSSSSSSSSGSTSGSSSSSSSSSTSSFAPRPVQAPATSAAVHHEEEGEGIIDRILNWLRVRLFGGLELATAAADNVSLQPAEEASGTASTANLEISVIVTLAAMMIVAFAFVRK